MKGRKCSQPLQSAESTELIFFHQYYHPKFRDKLRWCKDSKGWPQNSLVKEVLKVKSQVCIMFLKEVTMQRNTHNCADSKQWNWACQKKIKSCILLTSLWFGILRAWNYCRHWNSKSTKEPWSSEKTNLMWLLSIVLPMQGLHSGSPGNKSRSHFRMRNWKHERIIHKTGSVNYTMQPPAWSPLMMSAGTEHSMKAPKLSTSVSAVSQPRLIIAL